MIGRRLSLLLVLALALLSLPQRCEALNVYDCETLLMAKLSNDVSVEKAILHSVSSENIDYRHSRQLTSDVYLLSLHDGNQVVFRLDSDRTNDAAFEIFASRFAHRFNDHVHTPWVEGVSRENAGQILAGLRKAGLQTKRIAAQRGVAGTIAVFFPSMIRGTDYLAAQGLSFRQELAELAIMARNATPKIAEQYLKRAQKLWLRANSKVREYTLEDFLRLDTQNDGTVSIETLPAALFKASRSELGSKLVLSAWHRLEPEIKRQLADYWALCAILGIDDPHSNNWLIKGKHVLSIDLASKGPSFTRGRTNLEALPSTFPIGASSMDGILPRAIIKAINPKFLEALTRLDGAAIKNIGRESHFHLKELELRGVLDRIEILRTAAR